MRLNGVDVWWWVEGGGVLGADLGTLHFVRLFHPQETRFRETSALTHVEKSRPLRCYRQRPSHPLKSKVVCLSARCPSRALSRAMCPYSGPSRHQRWDVALALKSGRLYGRNIRSPMLI